MGTKTVRLEEDVYERVKERKRDDETFSEAVERLLSTYTLLDFAAETSPEGVEEMERALERLDERDADSLGELEQ